ncbi:MULTISPECIES: GNAT family N-acetyltransferase [Halomonadaceae]|uniref:GNAT family N-acetyltransferase n=1 Tax=Halomonadaceae TaxID=28256 RepID=UPI0004E2E150|nr:MULTISPECIES: GNAT family N-acetyltransferase [Halomonas]KFC51741.1 GNAT family acetyltransferase [Halomonas sp. SUBG004]MCG7576543.1 GNAT family N-acetyltransferase [Halomonas sp. MMH1-48]MCG7603606.1 GNAT family N-acetyltransferase [Halomonas sp. MM17-34]MCG7612922.1 GNAT family N-acetyltransferase [Halomonas sp. MM17-29]MCG7619457.1 GNAT family N-acetyltransferase [Halomonas sp. DSH1-27]
MEQNATVTSGHWEILEEHASRIRRVVFIDEQQVPQEEEWDGLDSQCLHFLAMLKGEPVGTARLLPDGHIGRVAVLEHARGLGIGYQLMEAAIQAARDAGHARAVLSAQLHALAFYEQLGFVAHGDVFMDAGIPHREMTLFL